MPSDSAGNATSSSGELNAAGTVALTKYYEGTYSKPNLATTETAHGKSIWIIDCGSDQVSCSAPGKNAERAAKLLGWSVNHVDGKSDTATQGNLIRQAISAGANGIVTTALDCSVLKQPMQDAKDAGIFIVAIAGTDCDTQGGKKLFDYSTQVSGKSNGAGDVLGDAQAAWIAGTVAKDPGQILTARVSFSATAEDIYKSFVANLATYCPSCKVVEMNFAVSDYAGAGLQQKVQTFLTKYPDIKAVNALFDGTVEVGLGAAIRAAGKTDLPVIGGQGSPTAIKTIQTTKEQDATVGESEVARGYESVDALNSLFLGEPIVPAGNGWQLVDANHNLPKGPEYIAPYNYEDLYKTRWNLS